MIGYFIDLHPELMGGASQRTFEVIRRTHLSGLDYLIIPGISMFKRTLKEKKKREQLLETLSKSKDKPIMDLMNILSDNSLFDSSKNYESFVTKYLERSGFRNVRFDIAYTSDAYINDFLHMKNFSRTSGMLLQIEPHYKGLLLALRRYRKFIALQGFSTKQVMEILRYFAYVYLSLQNEFLALNLIRKGMLKFILSVSSSPLKLSGIDRYDLLHITILDPAYAVEKELWKFNSKEKKEEYIVHYATLSPQKGLFDVVKVMYLLYKKYKINVKLLIFGRFSRDYYKDLFIKKVRSMGLEKLIEFGGYISDKRRIIDVVSRAKALIYPSHMDSFSLVVLEALAAGTPVVAYDIPALREIYGKLNVVKLVKEGDVAGLANALNTVLNNNEIFENFKDKSFLSFMEKYSSWDRVASREFSSVRFLVEDDSIAKG